MMSCMGASFVDQLRETLSSSKSRYLASITSVLVYISRCVNIKKRNHTGGNDFLFNFNIGCKRHTAELALIASRFSQALSQESFTIKW